MGHRHGNRHRERDLRGCVAASLLLAAAIGCGSSSPLTGPGRSEFAGVWQGEIRVTACTGDRHCAVFIGMTRPFLLRLAQSGALVTGVLVVGRPPTLPGAADVTVDVSGPVGADGTLVLTGLKPPASPFDTAGEVEVRSLVLRLSAQTGLGGSLDYVIRYTPDQNFETLMTTRAGEIVSATRLASDPASSTSPAEGHWLGAYVIRTCTLIGWIGCPEREDHTYLFDTTLTQTGTAVTGSVALSGGRVPLTGSIALNLLTLQGSATFPGSGGFAVVRVTAWSTTTDAVGRMHGSFTYVVEAHFTGGFSAGAVWSETYDAELVSVVLVPW